MRKHDLSAKMSQIGAKRGFGAKSFASSGFLRYIEEQLEGGSGLQPVYLVRPRRLTAPFSAQSARGSRVRYVVRHGL